MPGTPASTSSTDDLVARFPRTVAVVNLDAVAANVRALVRELGPTRRVMAVVKANAYGHGAVPVAIAALRAGAAALAVACVDEGIQLRQANIDAPVLILGATAPHDMPRVVMHGLMPTICDQEAARALLAAAGNRTRVPLHVKVDCGLHRFGIDADEAAPFVAWLAGHQRLVVDGLYTHFSSAEEADGLATSREFARFNAVVAAVQAQGHRPVLHAANSAATMGFPDSRLDMVRVGLGIYGLAGAYPGAARLTQWPALELHSRVSRVHRLTVDESVGYGRTYIATSDRTVALVGIGYADGLDRGLGNVADVLIEGRRAPILGRVSMDQIVVDVTGGDVSPGATATLIGRQGDGAVSASDLADLIGTIPYEIVVGLAPRVPRAYLMHGRLVGISDLLGHRQVSSAAEDSIYAWRAIKPTASLASGS